MGIIIKRFVAAAAAALCCTGAGYGAPAAGPAADISAELSGTGSLAVRAVLSLPGGLPGSFAVDTAGYDSFGGIGVNSLDGEVAAIPFTLDRRKGAAVIRWTCAPGGGRRRFEVRYTVAGALAGGRFADSLSWSVISAGQEYGFAKLSAALSGPEGRVTVLGGARLTRLENFKDGIIRLSTEDLPANSPLRITVALPKGTERGGLLWSRFMKLTGGTIAMFLLPLVSFLGLLAVFWARGVDPVSGLTGPAAGGRLPPEIAGTVMDEYADSRDLAAAALDMAREGYLEFEYKPAGEGLAAALKVKMARPPDGLPPHRKALAELLCSGGESDSGEGARVLDAVYDETARLGFFRTNPAAERQAYTLAGAALCCCGLALLLLGMVTPLFFVSALLGFGLPFALAWLALRSGSNALRWAFGLAAAAALAAGLAALQPALGAGGLGWTAKLGLGFLFSSFFFFAFAPAMPQRTARGSAEKAGVLAHRLSLESLRPRSGDAGNYAAFQEGLPFAVIFRIRTDWLRRHVEAGVLAPAWWKLRGQDGPQELSVVQADFLVSLDLLNAKIAELTSAGSGG